MANHLKTFRCSIFSPAVIPFQQEIILKKQRPFSLLLTLKDGIHLHRVDFSCLGLGMEDDAQSQASLSDKFKGMDGKGMVRMEYR